MSKVCSRCFKEKENTLFTKYKASKDGLSAWCKSCHLDYKTEWRKTHVPSKRSKDRDRAWKLQNTYNVSPEQEAEMLERQNFRCAICEEPFTKTPHLDHRHVPFKVRGFLCLTCNGGIGLLKEDTRILTRAIDYITQHNLDLEGK